MITVANDLGSKCDLLRSLHRPGDPLVLPNAWDAATARAVAAAGFPAVATTSAAVAAALGYDDHEGAPAGEMLAAAARITRSVDVPVTVDAEAGYGMTAAELAAALSGMGAAGCNLEDTSHATQALRNPAEQAAWLRAVRQAASGQGYRLVINARIDVFIPSASPGRAGPPRATWCRRPCTARGPTSTPAPTASTRSGCGRPERWRPSSRPARARSTYSASRRPPRWPNSPGSA